MSDTPVVDTQPEIEQNQISGDQVMNAILSIEDALQGVDRPIAFFALLAVAIVQQYPSMSDEQISKGVDRIAINIIQMCQEFAFENQIKEEQAAKSAAKSAN